MSIDHNIGQTRPDAALASLFALALCWPVAAPAQTADQTSRTYANPLRPVIAGTDLTVDSCADPTVIRGQKPGDRSWYMYCTTDPLHDADVDGAGELIFHRIPQLRSADLVNWTYVGDAFAPGPAGLPAYAEGEAALWAPEVVYSTGDNGDGDGQYLMFFGVTDTTEAISGQADCTSDGAIGMGTSETATGPWAFAQSPVVAPRRGGPDCNFKWTFDPEVLNDRIEDTGILYYGSYYGGIFGAPLALGVDGVSQTPDSGTADQTKAVMVALDNRYEGAEVVFRDGWYYIFVSATDCCNGALTGYSLFAGRAKNPLGPFVDTEGNKLTDPRVGGTPVLTMNGNRWVGPGHNTVFQDAAGDWWTLYHAVDRTDPFFPAAIAEGARGFTRRPVLLDRIDWVDGWPRVNGGSGPSDAARPAPAGLNGQGTAPATPAPASDGSARLLADHSDDFDGAALNRAWTWTSGTGSGMDPPAVTLADGALRLGIQTADTYVDVDTAQVLVRDAPQGDFTVEARVRSNVPAEGCCFNFVQVGIGIFGDEDNLVKLTETAIFNTRQTEWAKEVGADRVPQGWARYGNTVLGPPGKAWTYLRITVRRLDGAAQAAALGDSHAFTAQTSQDGRTWVGGATWTHDLGAAPRIALFAMGQQPAPEGQTNPQFTAQIDYVRVFAAVR